MPGLIIENQIVSTHSEPDFGPWFHSRDLGKSIAIAAILGVGLFAIGVWIYYRRTLFNRMIRRSSRQTGLSPHREAGPYWIRTIATTAATPMARSVGEPVRISNLSQPHLAPYPAPPPPYDSLAFDSPPPPYTSSEIPDLRTPRI